MIGPKA